MINYKARQRFIELLPPELKPPNPVRKQWSLTKSEPRYKDKDTYNFIVERAFMSLLTKVKHLYEGTGTLAFEFDMRRDKEFSSTAMHCFCTPDLYLELECTYELKCQVRYHIRQCPYEAGVLALFNSSELLSKALVPFPITDGVSAFYERVRKLHPASRFTAL